MKVQVESTTPLAQFTIEPRIDGESPSEFVLDASSSSDVDVFNGHDSLEYTWRYSNPEAVIEQND